MALTDDLVSWWTMKEASGDRSDSHGINVLTDVNTVGSAAGKVGTAASLVAANTERFTHADNSSLRLGGTDWTWSIWFYAASTPTTPLQLVCKFPGGANAPGYFMNLSSTGFLGAIGMGSNGNLALSYLETVPILQWNHVFFWYESATGRVYESLNNAAAKSVVQPFPQTDSTRLLEIGSRDGVQTWNGMLDEIALWKRALTADERAEIYNGGAGVTYLDIAAPPAASSRPVLSSPFLIGSLR